MTPSQIIAADHQRFGHDAEDTKRLMQAIVTMVNKHMATLVQNGDSLLLLTMIAPKTAELSFFTAETSPQKIKSAIQYFIGQVKKSGVTKVYGQDGGPVLNKTLELLKSLGVNVEKSDKHQFLWMAKV